jgi:hypothetical protein
LFGSPLSTGYGDIFGQFVTPFWVGFNGQIWSTGRGIIWYAPPLLLFPAGLWLLWRRDRSTTLLCALITAVHILFYAKWIAWDGAGAWGPRFLNTILPFMAVPLAAFLATLRGWRTPARTIALLALVLLTVPVQLGGLAINLNAYISQVRGRELSNYRLGDSAIVGHLRIAADQLRQLYDIRLAPDSIALVEGFSYSEAGLEQVPRWTQPHAVIDIRPPNSQNILVTLELDSCFVAPAPSAMTIVVDGTELVHDMPCPARVYRFALPARATRLVIEAPAWNPATLGGQRDETLGVLLRQIATKADGRPLALRGDENTVLPMPRELVPRRRWMSDHRLSHWDFWWWYILHDQLSLSWDLLLAGLWLTLGLGALLTGLRGLVRANRASNPA